MCHHRHSRHVHPVVLVHCDDDPQRGGVVSVWSHNAHGVNSAHAFSVSQTRTRVMCASGLVKCQERKCVQIRSARYSAVRFFSPYTSLRYLWSIMSNSGFQHQSSSPKSTIAPFPKRATGPLTSTSTL